MADASPSRGSDSMPLITDSPILLQYDLITVLQPYHTVRPRVASLVNGSSRAGLLVNTGIYVINIPGLNVTRITIQDNAVFLYNVQSTINQSYCIGSF